MPFKKGASGNPGGRPKGAKDRIPRSFRGLMVEVLNECSADVKKATITGIKSKQAYRYLTILASLEKQQHEHSGPDGGPIPYEIHDHFATE